MDFTLEMSSRLIRAPLVSSLMGLLVSQCLVLLISNFVRWGISDGLTRQQRPGSGQRKPQGAVNPSVAAIKPPFYYYDI